MNQRRYGYSNQLSGLSVAFGVIALITMCFIYSSLIFGGLSILFGLLSRGKAKYPGKQAKYGMILGIIAIAATLIIYITAISNVLTQYGDFASYMNEFFSGSSYSDFF